MSLADSEAAFEQHCKRISPDGSLHTLLTNQRISSLSSLAFAAGTPQSPPTEDQFREFATGINRGTEMTFGELSALRRLHFEASAIVMAELKSRATDTSGDGTRKLPVAEKTSSRPRRKAVGPQDQGRTSTIICFDRHGGPDEGVKLCNMDSTQSLQQT